MSSKASLTVLSLISCLTISQFAHAQAAPVQPVAAQAKAKPVAAKTAKAATPAQKPVLVAKNSQTDELTLDSPDEVPAAQTTPTTSGETRTSYVAPKDTSFDGYAKSVLLPTPDALEFMLGLEMTGQNSTSSTESKLLQNTGLKSTSKTTQNLTQGTFKPEFGITKNFFMGANLNYLSGTVNVDGNDQNGFSTNSNSKIDGMTEPSLIAGTQVIFGNTHLIGELAGKVPMGDAQYSRTGNDITRDSKMGGGSYTPLIATIVDVRKFKILGSLSYEVMSARKIDVENNNVLFSGNVNPTNNRYTQTTTGGNQMILSGGMEFPTLLNSGFVLGYIKNEDSKVSSDSQGSVVTQQSGFASGAAKLYSGITIGQNTMIVPQITYQTILDKSVDNLQYNQSDIWALDLSAKIKF